MVPSCLIPNGGAVLVKVNKLRLYCVVLCVYISHSNITGVTYMYKTYTLHMWSELYASRHDHDLHSLADFSWITVKFNATQYSSSAMNCNFMRL